MAEYSIIKLTQLTTLHIGTGKENYDFSASDLHSDTLSSALAAMRVQQGKMDVEQFLDSFVLSSAFPFFGKHLFFPKQQGIINISVKNQDEHEYRKKLKKIKYIDFDIWQKIIKGEQCEIDECQIQKEFVFGNNQDFHLFSKSQVNQRVNIPRADGQDAEPFFFDWKFFDPESGLFCLTDAKGDLLKEIIALFEILGETGIGTDKNVGGGKFKVETDTISITEVKDGDSKMLLSLYIPTEKELAELDLDNSKYELLIRGGFIAGSEYAEFRHLRKKSIYMFGVGSIFNTTNILEGKIVDLRPNWNDENLHKVFRSGKPLVISIKNNM